MCWDEALPVEKRMFVGDVESCCDEVFEVCQRILVECRVVDWCGKAVEVGHKHIELVALSVVLLQLHHWHKGTKIIAKRWLFIATNSGEDNFFGHIRSIAFSVASLNKRSEHAVYEVLYETISLT